MSAAAIVLGGGGHKDIAEQILGYLDWRSIFHALQVNRFLNSIVCESSRLQLELHAAYFGHTLPMHVPIGDTPSARLKRMRDAELAWMTLDVKRIEQLPGRRRWMPCGDLLVSFKSGRWVSDLLSAHSWTVRRLSTGVQQTVRPGYSFANLAVADDIIAVAQISDAVDVPTLTLRFYVLEIPGDVSGSKPKPHPGATTIDFDVPEATGRIPFVQLQLSGDMVCISWRHDPHGMLWNWRTGKLLRGAMWARDFCLCPTGLIAIDCVQGSKDATKDDGIEDATAPTTPLAAAGPGDTMVYLPNGESFRLAMAKPLQRRLKSAVTDIVWNSPWDRIESTAEVDPAGRLLVIHHGVFPEDDMDHVENQYWAGAFRLDRLLKADNAHDSEDPKKDYFITSTNSEVGVRTCVVGFHLVTMDSAFMPSQLSVEPAHGFHGVGGGLPSLPIGSLSPNVPAMNGELSGDGLTLTPSCYVPKNVKFEYDESTVWWMGADAERLFIVTDDNLHILWFV